MSTGRSCALALGFFAASAWATKDVEIRVEGQKAMNARRVESLLGLPDPRPDWRPDEWAFWAENAATLLAEAYRDLGYLDARANIWIPSADSLAVSPIRIGVKIEEGSRYTFGPVSIQLPEGRFPEYAAARLRCRPGRDFDKILIFRDLRDLFQFYGNAGFLKAQVLNSTATDTAAKSVAVAFQVNPGRALVFDTLVLGVSREADTSGRGGKTRPELLEGIFPLRRGDTLSLKDISAFERKLKSTRVYNFVRVRDSLLPDSSGGSALVLSAEEKVPGELDLSMFWENLFGFGGGLSWSHDNMGGNLHEGRVGLTLAQRKQAVLLGYASPLFFGTSVRFDNDFAVNWYQDDALVEDLGWLQGNFDVSNQAKLSRQLRSWMRFVSGAELLGLSFKIDSVNRTRDFSLNYLNSVFLHRLDDVVNPTRGARLSTTWGNGGPLIRNEELSVLQRRHNWLEFQSAGYFPLGSWLVVALRLDGGRFFGNGGINSQRFFLGGPRSVRSADWRHICPEVNDSTGVCLIEGIEPAYGLGSAELRLQPFQPSWIPSEGKWSNLIGLQLVPFVDYGAVWRVGHPLTASGEGRAAGLGLRYVFLALFNLRVDYARDWRRSGDADRWIFDLAQAF